MAAAPGGPLTVTLCHDRLELACTVKPCGAGFGADHVQLADLLRAGRVTTFGTW